MVRRAIQIALLALIVLSAPTAHAATLQLGFLDGVFTESGEGRDIWLDRARDSGSDVVRLGAGWAAVAPRRPASPADPADPAYDWARLDDAIRAAQSRGLEVILGLTGAPPWAEGTRRPRDAHPGTWRPDAAAYGDFARALATRYSGRSAGVPRVRLYQPWNEPNLDRYLAPQWERRGRRWVAASPGIYRRLLNAFARGVKSVDASNQVLAGTTAPFGDPFPGGERIQPARFVRELLRRPTVFDVLAHHPYSTRGPFAPALNGDDVSIPDIDKLTRPLRRAERAGRISPRGRKPVWVTEVSFDSRPPDPNGVPERRHAQWLAETFFVLWRQGVDLITWFQIRDQPGEPSFGTTYQSGVYLRDGTPKMAQLAFAFPMVARRGRARTTTLWARAPEAGRIVFERRLGGRWRQVAAASVARHGVVTRRARLPRGAVVRARLGDAVSLSARVG